MNGRILVRSHRGSRRGRHCRKGRKRGLGWRYGVWEVVDLVVDLSQSSEIGEVKHVHIHGRSGLARGRGLRRGRGQGLGGRGIHCILFSRPG